MERILGSAGTLVLVAVALALAAGRYEGVRLLLILELALLAAMIVLGLLLFSRRIGRHLEERLFPLQAYRMLAADTSSPEYGLDNPEITFEELLKRNVVTGATALPA